ncbi:Uncharacterised protein [uncultured archaeon]|nr:Uncharacterised protein [uncultured archaeon]
MVLIEEHIKNAKELLKDINEKVRSDLVAERQKLIGFAASEISCDLFAVLLHKKNLVTPGFNVNHRFFASEKSARERFAYDFPKKSELLPLLIEQENYRNILCYGKSKERKTVEGAIKNLQKIKSIIESETGERL